MTPRESAEEEAERTFNAFVTYSKFGVVWICIGLFVVVFACNNGVETGSNATGSGYNGEQYNPYNLNVKDNK